MSEKLLVPDIGEFEKVEVIELLVKVGDKINLDDPIVTIESDKSSVEIPSTVTGKVESVNIKVGDKVSKGDLLLSVESSKESPSEKPIPKDTESIIKQAESVLKNEKKEETTEQSPVAEKKQTIIQVTNDH
jgi:pyruvate dehydrogenase E1 component